MKNTITQIKNRINKDNCSTLTNSIEKAKVKLVPHYETEPSELPTLIENIYDDILEIDDSDFEAIPFSSRNAINSHLNQIETSIANFKNPNEQKMFNQIVSSYNAITLNLIQTGIKSVSNINSRINNDLENALSKFLELKNNHEKSITDINEQVTEKVEQLNQLNHKVEKCSTKIKEIDSKTKSVDLFKRFNEKRENLNKRSNWLLFFVSISLIISALFLIFLFKDMSFDIKQLPNEIIKYSAKLLLISPLLYLNHFLISEFKISRRLAEEYEFKSVSAGSMESYMNMISKVSNDNVHNILHDLVKETFSSPNKYLSKKVSIQSLNKQDLKKLIKILREFQE